LLIRRILQRGVDSGEFDIPDLDYAVFSVIAPMIHLQMNQHSFGACVPPAFSIDPRRYIAAQAEILLKGLLQRPGQTLSGGQA
jgi:hypothetical protein